MSINEQTISSAQAALTYLRQLAIKDGATFYFRGHRDNLWPLLSTYHRHKPVMGAKAMDDLKEMVDHFCSLLISNGITLPFNFADSRAKLEYARHYGLPTPLLDFSLSPYVAMFFAFNGTRPKAGSFACIFALDVDNLIDIAAQHMATNHLGVVDDDRYVTGISDLSAEPDFIKGYPASTHLICRQPASWNTRMIRQMGAFVYDSLPYTDTWHSSLGEFILQGKERSGTPTLNKINIPLSEGPKVFQLLELAGITGLRLLDDYEGAVADAVNAYSYNRKAGYFWDLGERSKP